MRYCVRGKLEWNKNKVASNHWECTLLPISLTFLHITGMTCPSVAGAVWAHGERARMAVYWFLEEATARMVHE